MADPKVVKPELAPLEFRTLAKLLEHWAGRADPQARRTDPQARRELAAKLPDFRAAVFMGEGSGGRESVPTEIVQGDYAAIYPGVRWLRVEAKGGANKPGPEWLKEARLPLKLSTGLVLRRPMPVPPDAIEEFARDLDGDKTPSQLAEWVVARRHLASEKSVQRQRLDESRFSPTLPQQFLASVFLDTCSLGLTPSNLRLAERILEVLHKSGYPPIMAYYLVQIAHDLPRPTCCGLCAEADIENACKALRGVMATGAATPCPVGSRPL